MDVGVVAQDHVGEVVGALCMTRPSITDLATAEAVEAWQTSMFDQGSDSQRLESKVTRWRWFKPYGKKRAAGINMGC